MSKLITLGLSKVSAPIQAAPTCPHPAGSITIDLHQHCNACGAAVTCATGNLFCDGQVYANGTVCPSDPKLKKEITPYKSIELPSPIRFTWKESGIKDIGFSATDVKQCVPEAVSIHPNGTQMVDYAKLVVTAIAEIHELKAKLAELEKRI